MSTHTSLRSCCEQYPKFRVKILQCLHTPQVLTLSLANNLVPKTSWLKIALGMDDLVRFAVPIGKGGAATAASPTVASEVVGGFATCWKLL